MNGLELFEVAKAELNEENEIKFNEVLQYVKAINACEKEISAWEQQINADIEKLERKILKLKQLLKVFPKECEDIYRDKVNNAIGNKIIETKYRDIFSELNFSNLDMCDALSKKYGYKFSVDIDTEYVDNLNSQIVELIFGGTNGGNKVFIVGGKIVDSSFVKQRKQDLKHINWFKALLLSKSEVNDKDEVNKVYNGTIIPQEFEEIIKSELAKIKVNTTSNVARKK